MFTLERYEDGLAILRDRDGDQVCICFDASEQSDEALIENMISEYESVNR